MPTRQRQASNQYNGEPSGYDTDGDWEDDLPLEELQFDRDSVLVNPFHHTSNDDLEPDRTSHQQRALNALERGANGSYKGKEKAKGRVLLPAGPSRITSQASPEPPRRRDHQASKLSGLDLRGGMAQAELYASYHGEFPLESVPSAEAEDPAEDLTTWPRADDLRVPAPTHTRRRQPDIEAQTPLPARTPSTSLEMMHIGVQKLMAPIVSYFNVNPTFKRHALALSVVFYMGMFAIMVLLLATGALTVNDYTPAGVVRENEKWLEVNRTTYIEHGS